MIVLDTNVIAELMRPNPEPRVLAWADRLDPAQVGITTMNEAEILHGIALPGERIWAFTREAAHWYGELLRQRELLGRPIATAAAVIAATTLARGAQLATRNGVDFAGIGMNRIDPWAQP